MSIIHSKSITQMSSCNIKVGKPHKTYLLHLTSVRLMKHGTDDSRCLPIQCIPFSSWACSDGSTEDFLSSAADGGQGMHAGCWSKEKMRVHMSTCMISCPNEKKLDNLTEYHELERTFAPKLSPNNVYCVGSSPLFMPVTQWIYYIGGYSWYREWLMTNFDQDIIYTRTHNIIKCSNEDHWHW